MRDAHASYFVGGVLSVALSGCFGGFCPPVFSTPFEFKPFLSFRAFRWTGQSVRNALSGHRYSTAAPAVHSGMQYGLP